MEENLGCGPFPFSFPNPNDSKNPFPKFDSDDSDIDPLSIVPDDSSHVDPFFPECDDSRRGRTDPIVHSKWGVVASDEGRCSEIGVSMLRLGGHAVDAAIATTLALGVTSQMFSGIGGGDFIVIHSSCTDGAIAIDAKETAPAAASKDMFKDNPEAKYKGPLSVAVPGKIAGLYKAWKKYGKLPWETLFKPAIILARNGFAITKFVAAWLAIKKDLIMEDEGMKNVYAPKGTVLKAGEWCYNPKLADTLEEIAKKGPEVFYKGAIGENLVRELKQRGGILTLDDLKNYEVRSTNALKVDSMGFTVYGMPLPSSGTVGLALILNILKAYGSPKALEGQLGLHRLVEMFKHMFAIRSGLGDPKPDDPAFSDINKTMSKMISPEYAEEIQKKILDHKTHEPDYYTPKANEEDDHGTSHLCVVDKDRNVVSLTASVNHILGSGFLSPSTGIVLNNHMDDFSIPTGKSDDKPTPSPANFIRPGKRPLSSMTPIIIFKDNRLVGALGGSGGLNIAPGVIQVFVNYFILGMKPLDAMKDARIYHRLIPNTVFYENWRVVTGEYIKLSEEKKAFLKSREHDLKDVPLIIVLANETRAVSIEDYIDLMEKVGNTSNLKDASRFEELLFQLPPVAVEDYRNLRIPNRKKYSLEKILPLIGRGNKLRAVAVGAYCNLVVQTDNNKLTAVGDVRKGGFPAAV